MLFELKKPPIEGFIGVDLLDLDLDRLYDQRLSC